MPVGSFEGGHLLLLELGLQIESRSRSLQLFRGHESRHSVTKWTGRRFRVVQTTHKAIKRWTGRQTNAGYDEEEYPTDDCIDIKPEDVHPEDHRHMTDRERTGRFVGVDTSNDERILGPSAARLDPGSSTSESSAEEMNKAGEAKRKLEEDSDTCGVGDQVANKIAGKGKKQKGDKTA
jgi:hypothetical protein